MKINPMGAFVGAIIIPAPVPALCVNGVPVLTKHKPTAANPRPSQADSNYTTVSTNYMVEFKYHWRRVMECSHNHAENMWPPYMYIFACGKYHFITAGK